MTQEDDDIVTRVPPVKNKGGVWVRMGQEEYRIPPLGLGAVKELQSRLDVFRGMSGVPSNEQMTVVAEVVQMAMRRNYPDITVEEVLEKLDLGNFKEVFDAVLSINGYRKAAPGEP